MLKRRTALKAISSARQNAPGICRFISNGISMDRVLVVTKLSRYEFERRKHHVDDKSLERLLRARGTDFDKLVHYHDLHKKFEEKVIGTFKECGIDVESVDRYNYTEGKESWANVVVPVGGDGTFLLASSRVKDNRKPVIGFNSDPNRSEGHLCLPKYYSTNIKDAILRLEQGKFEWLMRSRIRLKQISDKGSDMRPKFLHEDDAAISDQVNLLNYGENDDNVLPVLALNEVFVGETISAKVSHLKMRLNGSAAQTNMKCSGVCICTGTGSTSWHLSINRIPVQTVCEILNIVKVDGGKEKAREIADQYNRSVVFAADSNEMGYTIRDLISAAVWPQPKGIKSRGFAQKIELQSNCYDASLVIDGGVSFPFNDGTIVFLEIRPEDALRTVTFND